MFRTLVVHLKSHAVGYLALTVALGGTAYAAHQAAVSNAVIHACFARSNGSVRILASGKHCTRRERAIAWNRKGLRGLPGAVGPAGPSGNGGSSGSNAPSDGPATTASLRTLGTGALQAAAGNDARLSDARTPGGAAGGVLTGTYPSPAALAAGSVGAAQIATDAVTAAAIKSTIVTYDPSSVPAQSCVDDFVTVNGVSPNTPVLFIAMDNLPLGVFVANAHGSLVNSVRVRLCNVTAAAIDPGSANFSATVL